MLKKSWKFIVFCIVTIVTEIIIHTTDSILDSETTSKNLSTFKEFLFSEKFSLLVLILFIIAAFFLGAFIQDFFFNKNENTSNESKELYKHKKAFNKKRPKFYQFDSYDVYYDINWMYDGSPHAYNLKFYDRIGGGFYEAKNSPILYDQFNKPILDVNIIKKQIDTNLQQLWHGII